MGRCGGILGPEFRPTRADEGGRGVFFFCAERDWCRAPCRCLQYSSSQQPPAVSPFVSIGPRLPGHPDSQAYMLPVGLKTLSSLGLTLWRVATSVPAGSTWP